MLKRLSGGLIAALTFCMNVSASDDVVIRPVAAAYTYEIGSSNLADTYLTPLKYSGWNMAFSYERRQAMKFDPERWVQQLDMRVSLQRGVNPSGNASMWYGGIDARWAMLYRGFRPICKGLTWGVGAQAEVMLGCLYSARNGNNPAAARASVTVNAAAYVNYATSLLGHRLNLRYQPSLPVIGAFFSPDYGELYYEIYLGNHSGLAHCAWWGDYFRMDNLVTADWQLGPTTSLRLGYRGEIFTSRVSEITTRQFTHSLVLGVSGEWVSVSPSHMPSDKAKVISATY